MFKSKELQTIFDLEIESGNEILEISDWAPKNDKLVILRKRFSKKYEVLNGLEYKELNNPHYWHAQYTTEFGVECLACKE